MRKPLLFLATVLFAWSSLFYSDVRSEVYELAHLEVMCILYIDDLPDPFPFLIPLEEEAKPDKLSWGTGNYYDGADGKPNCRGDLYPYDKYTIAAGWFIPDFHPTLQPIGGGNIEILVDGGMNKEYWDLYFGSEYSKPAACDYSQNCHGFAFHAGDWPRNFGYLELTHGGSVGPSPGSDLGDFDNHPIGSGYSACWQFCQKKDAQVASAGVHSIHVVGTECEFPEESGIDCGPQPPSIFGGGLGTDDDVCKVQAIVSSQEQIRESGTYSRASGGCPSGLDVFFLHGVSEYSFFKFVGP